MRKSVFLFLKSIIIIIVLVLFLYLLNCIAVRELVHSIDRENHTMLDFWMNCAYNLNTDGVPMSSLISGITEHVWFTPLQEACLNGNKEIVEQLIKRGADVNYVEPAAPYSPLMRAIQSDKDSNYEIVKFLLDNNADPNYAIQQTTALTMLVGRREYNNGEEIVDLLIKYGADVNQNNASGSLMHTACYWKRDEMIRHLIKYCDVNYQTESGQTCLMEYLRIGTNIDLDTVHFLIENNADLSLKNNEGKTAYDYALETENTELINLFSTHTRGRFSCVND